MQLYDEKLINKLIKQENWENFSNKNVDPVSKYNKLKKSFDDIYNKARSKPSISKGNSKTEPVWITKKIKMEINKRDKLFKKWKKQKQNEICKINYQKQRKLTNQLINQAKAKSIYVEIERVKNDVKKTWSLINTITGRKSRASVEETITKYFSTDGKTKKSIAELFLTTFSNEIKKIITGCAVQLTTVNRLKTPQNILKWKKTSPERIDKFLCSMDSKKAPGSDRIRLKDLKKESKFSTIISDIVNDSLNTGRIPDELKLAIIRPLYKNSKHDDPRNYRPIAILNTLDKIIEKEVHEQFTTYLHENNLITRHQYGFQKNKSAELCLNDFCEYVNGQLHMNNNILVLFVDYSKAFDVLHQNVILTQLRNMGVKNSELKWFTDYLEDRQATVKLWDEICTPQKWETGVAQGSLIGPMLFLTTTNEIASELSNTKTFMFADDIAIVIANKDIKKANEMLESALIKLQKISHDLGLTINNKKTKIMHIRHRGPRQRKNKFTFHNHGCLHNELYRKKCDCTEHIDMVEEHKYLGIHIDGNFTWQPQIDSVCKRLRSGSAVLNRLKYGMPLKIRLVVYHALIESVLSYGITSWGRDKNSYLNKVQLVQNRIVKSMLSNKTNRKYINYSSKFKHLKILTIENLLKYKIIKENYFNDDFKAKATTRPTRNKPRLNIPLTYNKYGERLNKVFIAKCFNEIPITLLNEKKIGTVKRIIKEWLTNKCKYTTAKN